MSRPPSAHELFPRGAASTPAPAGDDAVALVRAAYDRGSHAYRADGAVHARSGYAHWLRRLAAYVPDGASVLDLGCGSGEPATRELARRHRVTGIDVSPVQIERAREHVPAATFVCGDMTRAEFADGSFDAVVAFYSIINVPLGEQPALIARIGRWLAPGGTLLAIVGRVARTVVEPDWRGTGAPMVWSFADAATYRAWCADAGLTVVEEGVQPKGGRPGFAVLIARAAAGA